MLFTDRIKITPVEVDTTYNTSTKITDDEFFCSAYIEDNTEIGFGADGQPQKPDFLFMLPPKTSIKLADIIEIVQIHKREPFGSEEGEKQVKAIKRVGGIRISHIEVAV